MNAKRKPFPCRLGIHNYIRHPGRYECVCGAVQDPSRNAVLVVKSAEGRRTCNPTKEERDRFEKAGIKRVGNFNSWHEEQHGKDSH